MNELKASITILVSFVIAVLGLGNIEQFQESILDFSPIFFILVAVVVFSELILINMLIRMGVKVSYYAIIGLWVIVYTLIWVFYLKDSKPIEVHLIQILLIVLSSLLAYDVGRRVGELDKTLEGLSSSAYPNRARDIQSSQDLIASEITRSRRYHHPLSILTVRLEKPKNKAGWKDLESLADDMFERFAVAKASKIFSDLARNTDLVLLDRDGQFVLLCPETNLSNIKILAERLEVAVEDGLHTKIEWGIASFPDEALTFDDLLQTAQKRISESGQMKITEESV
jgi:GGDEF domain-containing protein